MSRTPKTQLEQPLRLRLKPEPWTLGPVDGAWWPRSRALPVELLGLLPTLSEQIGHISGVIYDPREWLSGTKFVVSQEGPIRTTASPYQPPNTMHVVGQNNKKLTLLVIPHRMNSADADLIMSNAASLGNAEAPDKLLAIRVPDSTPRQDMIRQQRQWVKDWSELGK
ncbi:MAG: DUF5994 family protein [Segniliparus sp.]|uniref:DUF5994 family protein n=1 Tax=Segniliparus sp. TaxID=2804064 RepID=UPI003F336E44